MKPSPGRRLLRMHGNRCYVKLRHEPAQRPTRAYWTISSPSRFPFRPPLPLTFPFRVQPSRSASTYSGPVLGARRNLGRRPGPCKGSKTRRGRNLRKFNYPHVHSRPCSVWITRSSGMLPRLPRSRPVNVRGRAPAHALLLARLLRLHVGALPGRLHLDRDGRDRDHAARRRSSSAASQASGSSCTCGCTAATSRLRARGASEPGDRRSARIAAGGSDRRRSARAGARTRACGAWPPPLRSARAGAERLWCRVSRGRRSYCRYRRLGPARLIPPRREGTKRSCGNYLRTGCRSPFVTGVPSAVRSRIGTGVPSSRVWTTPSVEDSGATAALRRPGPTVSRVSGGIVSKQ